MDLLDVRHLFRQYSKVFAHCPVSGLHNHPQISETTHGLQDWQHIGKAKNLGTFGMVLPSIFCGSPVRGPVDFAQVWQPMLRVLTARNTVFVVCTAIVIHVAPRDTHPRSVPGRIGIIDQQRGTGVFQCKSCAKVAGTRLLTLRRNIFRRLNNNHCLVLDCPLSTTCPGCPQCATCQARFAILLFFSTLKEKLYRLGHLQGRLTFLGLYCCNLARL